MRLDSMATMAMAAALCTLLLCGGDALAGDVYDPVIDPAEFEDSAGVPLPINNRFLPMVPGTTFVYEGEGDDGFEHNEVFISHDTKEILGVTCTVVEDRVWLRNEDTQALELEEETFDWHAQDRDGNVWYFGESSFSRADDGTFVDDGSWEAGVDGALPGIVMQAVPHAGATYRQEYYEGEAEDMGKVLRLNVSVSVEYGDFEDCLKTKEWTPLSPGEVEHKYYADGIGLVLVESAKDHFELIAVLED